MEEDKLRLRNEQLKYKEDAIKDIEKRYEERLQNEIIKYNLLFSLYFYPNSSFK